MLCALRMVCVPPFASTRGRAKLLPLSRSIGCRFSADRHLRDAHMPLSNPPITYPHPGPEETHCMVFSQSDRRFWANPRHPQPGLIEGKDIEPTFRISLCDLSHFCNPVGGPLQSPHQQRRLLCPTNPLTVAKSWITSALSQACSTNLALVTSSTKRPAKTRKCETSQWGKPSKRWCSMAR